MADRRTRREKLQAMASQSVSPQEAEIARRKLANMPPPRAPVQQPTAAAWDESHVWTNLWNAMRRSGEDVEVEIDVATHGMKVRRRHHDDTGRAWYEWEDA